MDFEQTYILLRNIQTSLIRFHSFIRIFAKLNLTNGEIFRHKVRVRQGEGTHLHCRANLKTGAWIHLCCRRQHNEHGQL